MRFTIYFIGLIAHIVMGSGNGRRAVLINPDDIAHAALMIVQCADIIELQSVNMKCRPNEVEHAFEIGNGRHLEVQAVGTSGLSPTPMPSFDKLVPHLSLLIDKSADLTPNAKFGRKHSRVSTYVDYEGGQLVATNQDGPFKLEKVTFDYLNPSTQCIATRTAYVLPSAPAFVVIQDKDSTDKLTLKGTATITITNLPQPMNSDDHFVDFNWITNSVKIAHLSPVDNSCDPVTPEVTFDGVPDAAMKHARQARGLLGKFAVTAECTNSQFP